MEAADRKALLAVVALTGFFALSTLLWIHRDTVPPLWDTAQYLQESERIFHAWEDRGAIAAAGVFSGAIGNKAPLISALPLPFYATLGESHFAARCVNLVLIVVASWLLYRIGERVAGPWCGALAVAVLNTFPIVAGMSRQYLVEYGLMTIVIAWIYCLLRWHDGSEAGASWALGLLFGLGMLMKVSFPLYVAAPTAVVLLEDVRARRKLGVELVASWLRILAVGLPIAALWYFRNWKQVFDFAVSAGYGELGRPYGRGGSFSLAGIGEYWLDIVNRGVAAYSSMLLIAVAAWCAVGKRRRGERCGMAPADFRLLTAWWLVPAIALTLAVNREGRYTVPFLPAWALLLSAGWLAMTRRAPRWVMALLPLLGLANYAFYSAVPPASGPKLSVGRVTLLSSALGWAHAPEAQEWPNDRVRSLVADDAAQLRLPAPRATVLFSHPCLNAHNLNYLSALHRSPVRFRVWHFQSTVTAAAAAEAIVSSGDYIIVKSANLGPADLNAKSVETLSVLQAGGFPFDEVGAVPLPDGSAATVFRPRSKAGNPQ